MAFELKKKIKKWISSKAEQCKNVAPLYSFALDRKLSVFEKIRVRFHLLTCNACTSYVTNLNFMRDVLRAQEENLKDEKLHVTLSDEAKERMKKNLRAKS